MQASLVHGRPGQVSWNNIRQYQFQYVYQNDDRPGQVSRKYISRSSGYRQRNPYINIREIVWLCKRLSSTRQAWSIFAEHRIELSRTEYYTIAVVKFRGTKDSTTSSLKGFVQASLSRTRQPWSSFAEHRTEQN